MRHAGPFVQSPKPAAFAAPSSPSSPPSAPSLLSSSSSSPPPRLGVATFAFAAASRARSPPPARAPLAASAGELDAEEHVVSVGRRRSTRRRSGRLAMAPPMSPVMLGARKTSALSPPPGMGGAPPGLGAPPTQHQRRGSFLASMVRRKLSVGSGSASRSGSRDGGGSFHGVGSPPSGLYTDLLPSKASAGGMRRNPDFFADQGASAMSSDNPMFHVKSPSFSSPAGSQDRRSLRKSRKQSRMEEILADDASLWGGVGDDASTDFGSMRSSGATRASDAETSADADADSAGNEAADAERRRAERQARKERKERREQRRATRERAAKTKSKASSQGGQEAAGAERRRSSYVRQSTEVPADDWVNRMDAIMQLRRKHRSFRKAEIVERPPGLDGGLDDSENAS